MIPFLDLARDFAEVEADARRRLDGVLSRQQFVLGPETAELEDAMKRRLGATSAVAVSSGTEALSLSLLALGIGAGDAVLLPAFTFFATAGAVARAGAVPVFCDIDPATFVADEAAMQRAVQTQFAVDMGELRHRRSGARLAALMPVHLYGRACAMAGIRRLADELGLAVVEDAAQALDARVDGKAVGRFGTSGCFSFYPTKNLGGAGDGGLVVTDDAALGSRLAKLRTHGGEPGSYEHHEIGINARMSEMVAAVLNAKLARLDAWNARRREVAAHYASLLEPASAYGIVLPGAPGDAASHVWHQYAIRVVGDDRRDRVRRGLQEAGVATSVFYPLPLHLQPCFAHLGARPGDFRHSEAASREVLCLPMRPSLADGELERVATAVARVAAAVAS